MDHKSEADHAGKSEDQDSCKEGHEGPGSMFREYGLCGGVSQ